MPIQRSLGIGGAHVIRELHQRLQVTGQQNLLPLGFELGFQAALLSAYCPGACR